MWYKISQQQAFDNLAASSSPSMVYQGASQGIKTDAAGKAAVQKFMSDGIPTAIRDVQNNKMITLAHGNLTNGQFSIVDQNGTGIDQNGYPADGSRQIQWGWSPVGGSFGFDRNLTPNSLLGIGTINSVTVTVN